MLVECTESTSLRPGDPGGMLGLIRGTCPRSPRVRQTARCRLTRRGHRPGAPSFVCADL